MHDQDQWVEAAEDDEVDEDDILHLIMTSGILDWNQKGSLSVRSQSTEIYDRGKAKQINDSMQYKPRRPRGRPARKATTKRKRLCSTSTCIHLNVGIGKQGKIAVSINKAPSLQERANGSKLIIRATSKPVVEDQQEHADIAHHQGINKIVVQTENMIIDKHVTGEACVDINDTIQCMEGGIVSERVSTNRRHRGRPKKRIFRPKVTGQSYCNDS